MEKLLDIAIEYAEAKNLIAEEYLDGMLTAMENNQNIDFEKNIEILIRYHKEWLKAA